METMDTNFIPQINNQYAFIVALIMIICSFITNTAPYISKLFNFITHKSNSKDLNKKLDKQSLLIKRLELLHLFSDDPSQTLLINNIYDEYKKEGGNSYIDQKYQDWLEYYNNNKKLNSNE